MTDYTKATNFTAKDSLVSGNANKIVKGAEIDDEFDLIDTPLQGQFPDWYVENLKEYKYLKQGREL